MKQKHCIICGDIYPALGGQKTCTPDCSAELHKRTATRLHKAKNAERRADTIKRRERAPDKTCKVCSAPFRPDGTDRETCSDACSEENARENKRIQQRRNRIKKADSYRATARRYRQNNLERIRAYDNAYKRRHRAENPDKEAAYKRERRRVGKN